MPRSEEGFFSGRDNTRLFWQSLLPDGDPVAFVGVVHGYGDHSGRYTRFMHHLVDQGLGVLAFDYRGHGRADGKRGYCERWGDYLSDLEVFWARLRGMASGKPVFLFAHSHGGLMALHWVVSGVQGLKGLMLSAPYLALALDPPKMKIFSAKVAGLVIPWLPVPTGIEYAQLSRDPKWQEETKADPLYGTKATPRWFVQSTQAQEAILKVGDRVSAPLLMCTGGDDPIASTATSRRFFDTLGSSDKRYIEYPGMRHEIVCEVDKERCGPTSRAGSRRTFDLEDREASKRRGHGERADQHHRERHHHPREPVGWRRPGDRGPRRGAGGAEEPPHHRAERHGGGRHQGRRADHQRRGLGQHRGEQPGGDNNTAKVTETSRRPGW